MIETRYKNSVDPIVTDGRDIDTSVAQLTGEASQQEGHPTDPHAMAISRTWEKLPGPRHDEPTYYDVPVLKSPVWRLDIPLYYFVGGAAGASLALGAAAQITGSRDLDRLIRNCHWTGIIGSSIGGVLLIHDLGRPSRFMYMMRVFRPTSPMNMGVWILSGTAPLAITAGLFLRKGGILGRISEVLGYCSGIIGLALASYTGVLVANTAVPVWQAGRRILPVLFASSAVASAGSIFDIAFEDPLSRRITYTFGLAGRVAELTSGIAMERAVTRIPRVGKPLRSGKSGVLWRTATVLTAASLVTMVLPNRTRRKRVISGVLGTAGSLLLRFAVHQAGVESARDPRATFEQQRAGFGAAELEKKAAHHS